MTRPQQPRTIEPDELLEHMIRHMDQMQESFPDSYHQTLAAGMKAHPRRYAETRSRPIPSPENPCEENGCTDTDNCDEICENRRIYSPAWVKKHDAAIKEQAIREYRMRESGFSSTEILNLAKNDWHKREERRGIHPEVPFVAGWVTGFLTQEKPDWNKVKEATARTEAAKAECDRIVEIAEQLANRIPDFNRMDYIHLFKEKVYKSTPTPSERGDNK